MLDPVLGTMQNHHPGVFAALKRTLRNQFPWQNVIVIAKSCAHRSIESNADPRGNSAFDLLCRRANVSRKGVAEAMIAEMICTKASAARRCLRDDNRF